MLPSLARIVLILVLVLIVLIAGTMILRELGLDIGPIIAGAGIVGLAMADVFVRMVEAADTPRFADTSLSGWLYRIAHNLLVDHFRRQRAEVALPEELPVSAAAQESDQGPAAIVERKLA